jgi:hypothetical protein
MAFASYLLTKFLPIRVTDRYFTISPESPSYPSGYILSGFNYEKQFYLYIPVLLGIHQLTKFITLRAMGIIILANCIVGNILGQYLVNKRVSEYEVW